MNEQKSVENNESVKLRRYIVISADMATYNGYNESIECSCQTVVLASDESEAKARAQELNQDGVVPIVAYNEQDLNRLKADLKTGEIGDIPKQIEGAYEKA